ncbi:MAG: hypothetical protein ABSF03_23085 [Streptosporangiaceae bacterium]
MRSADPDRADRDRAGISLETALVTARQTLASVAERAKQGGYYSGARTDIINAHADLRAALDMLVKAAGPAGPDGGRREAGDSAPGRNPG